MNTEVIRLINLGYSPVAIAMQVGGPVGTENYHSILRELDDSWGKGCQNCGKSCFGTGYCNCMDE